MEKRRIPKRRERITISIIYPAASSLERHEKIDGGECVALVKHFTILKYSSTSAWMEGQKVMGNLGMISGAAIATFVHGRYPNHSHGNHAAFFLRHGPNGFWIIDQWRDGSKPLVTARYIETRGKKKDGTYVQPSDNADAFSTIEINGPNR